MTRLFFIDGCYVIERAGRLLNNSNSSLDMFKCMTKSRKELSLDVHCIGFTSESEHDALLLIDMLILVLKGIPSNMPKPQLISKAISIV